MPTEDTTGVDKPDIDTDFDRIMDLPFMRSGRIMKGSTLPYSKLDNRFFDKMWDKLAEILPVLALGYNDPEVRRLASELFGSLCLHRNGSDS